MKNKAKQVLFSVKEQDKALRVVVDYGALN